MEFKLEIALLSIVLNMPVRQALSDQFPCRNGIATQVPGKLTLADLALLEGLNGKI